MPPSFFSLASRAIVHIPSGTLSHHLFVFWRSKSFLLICIIQSHSPWHSYSMALHVLPSWLCIYPHFPHRITLCLSLICHCSSRFLFSLLMTQSFEFTPRALIMLLDTLHLALSCSSLWAVFLGHALYCILKWFDCYSFWYGFSSHFWRHLRESLSPWCDFRVILRHPSLLGLEPLCSTIDLSKSVFH